MSVNGEPTRVSHAFVKKNLRVPAAFWHSQYAKRRFGLFYRNKYIIYENFEKWIVFLSLKPFELPTLSSLLSLLMDSTNKLLNTYFFWQLLSSAHVVHFY